ncbi:MAG: isoaspartyl peptidase/L-asparaginase [Bacteroidetes bacterium]|nr:isoaspartyl peptidase/L-asparaginase [Bacteroidota bacterium]
MQRNFLNRRTAFLLTLFLFFILPTGAQQTKPYTLVIHGGAGTITRANMTPQLEQAYYQSLHRALDLGEKMLASGQSALDVVEKVVRLLEDDSLFNAGKGAVFTNAGEHELDAAIMDGRNLMAGSVAGVKTIRNPISAARAVMEKTEHVMLSGIGAEAFARQIGLEMVPNTYFNTESRRRGLKRAIEEEKKNAPNPSFPTAGTFSARVDWKYGTVGAVVVDQQGNLAAATSTGGMTNKRFGRIGDAPIIGAGTYADSLVAVSCTGWGEYFIRMVMAKSLADRIRFAGESLKQAGDQLIKVVLPALGGDGGLIAVDRSGEPIMPFCTEGMYRGYIRKSADEEKPRRVVAIYGN